MAQQPPSGTQRAREDTPKPDERLKRIKRMMVEGEWREGVSDHELAEEWGIDPSTVRHSSAEASRALRNAVTDEGLAARLVSILLNNVHDARKAKRYEAVARSVEVAAKILGVDGEHGGQRETGPLFILKESGEAPESPPDAA